MYDILSTTHVNLSSTSQETPPENKPPGPQLLNHLALQSPIQPHPDHEEKTAASVATIGLTYCKNGEADIGLVLIAASGGLTKNQSIASVHGTSRAPK
jgi:hypothetical protein